MADYFECHRRILISVKTEYTDPETENPQAQLSEVKLSFSSTGSYFKWVLRQDSTEPDYERQYNRSVTDAFLVNVSRQRFKELRQVLEEEINRRPYNRADRGMLIDVAWNETMSRIKSKPTGHRVMNLHFEVIVEHHHVFLGEISASSGMVPASDSSIEASKRVDVDEIMSCSICLEDFDREALSMPCSHIFHHDCIKKWLKTSHYCPLCRTEMPTSE